MKYYTWKLKWSVNPTTNSEEGIDPTYFVNNETTRVEPMFCNYSEEKENNVYYAVCLKGSLVLSSLTDWSVEETTAEATLAAAQELNADATMVEGRIHFPEI